MMDYKRKVSAAMRHLPISLKPVVEKEILHYGILEYMQQAKYLQHVVFMGGTSLRLCHGSKRYSEDLDFSGGKDFNPTLFREMTVGLEAHIRKTYDLPVHVKPPKSVNFDPVVLNERSGVSIDKWTVSVETNPGKKDIPRQKVKIEFANVPAHDIEFRKTVVNYDDVLVGANILMQVSSKSEILADKLFALPMAKYDRFRDIWDIVWLHEQGAQINTELLDKKIHDYGQTREVYLHRVTHRLATLKDMIQGETFLQEMTRFLGSSELQQIENPMYRQYFTSIVQDDLRAVQEKLSNPVIFAGALNKSTLDLAPKTTRIMPTAAAAQKYLHDAQKRTDDAGDVTANHPVRKGPKPG